MKMCRCIMLLCVIVLCVAISLNHSKSVENYGNIDFKTDPTDKNVYNKIDVKNAHTTETTNGYVKDIGFNKNTNTQYHDDVDTISADSQKYGIPSGTKWIKDDLGNTVPVLNDLQGSFLYYDPSTRSKYGSANYVPSYEDSVYLSKYNTTMRSSVYAK